MSFHIQIIDKREYFLVEIYGRLDRSNDSHLSKAFDEIEESGRFKVILNLSKTTFLCSRALWMISEAEKKGGHIFFFASQDSAFRIWLKEGWLFGPKHWILHDTLDAAQNALNEGMKEG